MSKTQKKLYFTIALVIALIVLIAAIGKFFYPKESLKVIDRTISIFEILFLLAIFFFRLKWQAWSVAAVVFAAWCGYVVFWCCLELPCSCMGEKIEIASSLSISLDVIFFLTSLVMIYFLKARLAWIYFTVLCSFLSALIGYAFAEWTYYRYILMVY